jgi:hypothetical protein
VPGELFGDWFIKVLLLVRRVLCCGEATGRALDRTATANFVDLGEWGRGRGRVFRVGAQSSTLAAMDDEAALLERQVAMAASAWRRAKADTEAYRRLVVATSAWDAYVAPTLDEPAAADVAAQLRRAAREALRATDDEATRLAHLVTTTASVWLHAAARTDSEAYARFDRATELWDAYAAPQLGEPTEELLDQLADDSAPVSLGEVVADVSAQIRKAARRGS